MSEPDEQSLTALADAAFRQAAVKVILRAKQAGTQLILWGDDGIRYVSPHEYELPSGPTQDPSRRADPEPR
jgi:hypothetical protein